MAKVKGKKKGKKTKAAAAEPAVAAAAEQVATPAVAGAAPAAPGAGVVAGTVFAELSGAVNVMPAAGMSMIDYSVKLVEAVAALTDEQFGKLGKPAQNWFNATASVINASTDEKTGVVDAKKLATMPELEGFASDGSTPAAPAVARVQPRGTAAAAAPVKAAKAPKEPKEPKDGTRADSVAHRIRVEVCKKPDITFEALLKTLKESGLKAIDEGFANNFYRRTKRVLDVKAAVDAGTMK